MQLVIRYHVRSPSANSRLMGQDRAKPYDDIGRAPIMREFEYVALTIPKLYRRTHRGDRPVLVISWEPRPRQSTIGGDHGDYAAGR